MSDDFDENDDEEDEFYEAETGDETGQLNNVQGSVRFVVFLLPFLMCSIVTFLASGGLVPFIGQFTSILEEFTFLGTLLRGVLALVIGMYIADLISSMIYILPQWQRILILRLGRFERMAGPGIVIVPPFLWSTVGPISLRTQTRTVKAAQTITQDNIPVDAEAVIFFKVDAQHPERVILEVDDYMRATYESAQAALRQSIGSSTLAQLREQRESVGSELKDTISSNTDDWGVIITRVTLKDIVIPRELQDAMSRNAQAAQERLARIALAEAELEVSEKFAQAAKVYADNPVAMQLRQLDVIAGIARNSDNLIIVPSDALNSLSGVAGLASLRDK